MDTDIELTIMFAMQDMHCCCCSALFHGEDLVFSPDRAYGQCQRCLARCPDDAPCS